MKRIAIVIPYLRGENLREVLETATGNAGLPAHHFDFFPGTEPDGVPKGMARMFNALVKDLTDGYDLVVYLADDTEPQPGWLIKGLNYMNQFEDSWGIVGFADGRTKRDLPFHFLGHKKMLPHLGGKFLHEGYHHCYVDNELYERAKAIGRYKWAEDAVVLHHHPMLNPSIATDEHYQRAYDQVKALEDHKLFERRKANNWSDLV